MKGAQFHMSKANSGQHLSNRPFTKSRFAPTPFTLNPQLCTQNRKDSKPNHNPILANQTAANIYQIALLKPGQSLYSHQIALLKPGQVVCEAPPAGANHHGGCLHPPRSQGQPYTLHPSPHTPHPTPHTLHPKPYTPHPTPYNLHPTPHTPHPTPY